MYPEVGETKNRTKSPFGRTNSNSLMCLPSSLAPSTHISWDASRCLHQAHPDSQLWQVAPEYPVPEQSQLKVVQDWEHWPACSHRFGRHLERERDRERERERERERGRERERIETDNIIQSFVQIYLQKYIYCIMPQTIWFVKGLPKIDSGPASCMLLNSWMSSNPGRQLLLVWSVWAVKPI